MRLLIYTIDHEDIYVELIERRQKLAGMEIHWILQGIKLYRGKRDTRIVK